MAHPMTNPHYYRDRARRLTLVSPDFVERTRRAAREYQHRLLLERHGMTEAEYDAMLEGQGFQCAICKSDFYRVGEAGHSRAGKPHLDHDHETGEVRGLLCLHCNTLLGYARDEVEVLNAAIAYLQTARGEH